MLYLEILYNLVTMYHMQTHNVAYIIDRYTITFMFNIKVLSLHKKTLSSAKIYILLFMSQSVALIHKDNLSSAKSIDEVFVGKMKKYCHIYKYFSIIFSDRSYIYTGTRFKEIFKDKSIHFLVVYSLSFISSKSW